MRPDLGLGQELLNPDVFGTVFNNVLRNINLRELARGIAQHGFASWKWATVYAARWGAGTSHITTILTFAHRFGGCPARGFVPDAEWRNLRAALTALEDDPLLLFPIGGEVDRGQDQFRASAMPGMLTIALAGLKAAGDPNWGRYQNQPYLVTLGAASVSEVKTATVLGLVQLQFSMESVHVAHDSARGCQLLAEKWNDLQPVAGVNGMEKWNEANTRRHPAGRGSLRRG